MIHFVSPLIARDDEGSEVAAAEANGTESPHNENLQRQLVHDSVLAGSGRKLLDLDQIPFCAASGKYLFRILARRTGRASALSKLNNDRWEKGFAALSKFFAREGHCCPGRHHIEGTFKLGDWVSVQRYREDLVPIERKRRLDEIGFVWDWRDSLWEQKFAALLKFKRREGHCCVPTHHRENGFKLGWWVATQRRNINEMSKERRGRLNKVGFDWEVQFMGPIAYRPSSTRSQGPRATR